MMDSLVDSDPAASIAKLDLLWKLVIASDLVRYERFNVLQIAES